METINKSKYIHRLIIVSWVALIVCFLIKIFGGNFFEIMCQSQNYKALCEYADNNFWLKAILMALSSFVCQTLYILAIVQEWKLTKNQFLIIILTVIVNSGAKEYSIIGSYVLDVFMLFIMPMLFLGKNFKKYWHILIAFLLTFAFQGISLLTKNLSFGRVDDSTFISLIFGIDVYIMCFLYYLYRNSKRKEKE